MEPLIRFTTVVSDVKFTDIDENCFRVDVVLSDQQTTDVLISPYKIPLPGSIETEPDMVDNTQITQQHQGLAQFVIKRLIALEKPLTPGTTYHIRFFFEG